MQASHTGLGHTADGADFPSSRCCPGDAGTVAFISSGAHPVARAPEVSDSSKSTVPLIQRPGIRHHIFALTVPFSTSLEAEIACGSLAPDAEPHQELLRKELKVSGCMLEVAQSKALMKGAQLLLDTRLMICSSFCRSLCFRQEASLSSE
ncbi:hypothetical protein A6R68_21416, partial [Neotoma lepida]